MGWGSGSELMCHIIDTLKTNVVDEKIRKNIYIDLINEFENMDCDTLCECMGEDEAYDTAMIEIYPEIDNDFEK